MADDVAGVAELIDEDLPLDEALNGIGGYDRIPPEIFRPRVIGDLLPVDGAAVLEFDDVDAEFVRACSGQKAGDARKEVRNGDDFAGGIDRDQQRAALIRIG